MRAAVAAMGVVAPEGTLVRTGGRLHATPSFAMLPRARARAGPVCCRLRACEMHYTAKAAHTRCQHVELSRTCTGVCAERPALPSPDLNHNAGLAPWTTAATPLTSKT